MTFILCKMKKIKKYILDAITFIIAFYSCSNENVSSQNCYRRVETTEDGLSETFFAYDGNKITSINSLIAVQILHILMV
jgi:hypothetical protein